MSRLNQGVRDFLAIFAGKFGAIFLAVISQVVLARVLGPSGRGSLYICQVFQLTLTLVFMIGTDTAVVFFVSSRRFSLSEGVTYSLLIGAVLSIIAVTVGWFLIFSGLEYFARAAPSEFMLVLLLVPLTLFGLTFQSLLTSVGRFGFYGIITLIRAAVQVICSIVLVWWAGWGVSGGIWAGIFAQGFGLLLSIFVLVIFNKARLVRPSLKKAGQLFLYGARYYFGKLSNIVNMEVGSIVLGFLAAPADIGYFSVAYRLIKQIDTIPQALATILFPRAASSSDGSPDLIARTARITLFVCGGILLLVTIFSRPLIVILFSQDFLPAVPLLRIFCVGIAIRCLGKILAPYFIGTNHPGFASLAVVAGTIVNIGFLIILLPLIGIQGAAWGMTGSYLLSTAILLWGFVLFSGIPLTQFFSFRRGDFSDLIVIFNLLIRKRR